MIDLVASEKQRKFGQDKRDTLPRYCGNARFGPYATASAPRTVSPKHPTAKPG